MGNKPTGYKATYFVVNNRRNNPTKLMTYSDQCILLKTLITTANLDIVYINLIVFSCQSHNII